jgi:hypothetical protein
MWWSRICIYSVIEDGIQMNALFVDSQPDIIITTNNPDIVRRRYATTCPIRDLADRIAELYENMSCSYLNHVGFK